jgi:ABC-type transport system involved in Fe-S cluster assembly fused permease/ATPase subunit
MFTGLPVRTRIIPKISKNRKLRYNDAIIVWGGTTMISITQRKMLVAATLRILIILISVRNALATAAIDPIQEAELYKKFFELCRGKTSIFVTHRLGSVLYSDLILFFKDGVLFETGSHNELLALKGEYAKFWNTQTAAYKLG